MSDDIRDGETQGEYDERMRQKDLDRMYPMPTQTNVADDKTAAEAEALRRYPPYSDMDVTSHIAHGAFVAGAAWAAARVTVAPDRVQGLADRMRSQAAMLRVAPILWVEIQSARMLLEEGAALLASGVLGVPADQVRAEGASRVADALEVTTNDADEDYWNGYRDEQRRAITVASKVAAEYRKAAGA